MPVYQTALRKKAEYLEIYLSYPYIQSAQAESTAVTSLELGDTNKNTQKEFFILFPHCANLHPSPCLQSPNMTKLKNSLVRVVSLLW